MSEGVKLLIDGSIIIFYFVSITAIGLYMGRKEHNLEDYALGGRRIPWWAVMASIIAAETSAATFLGAPVEGYSTQALVYVQLTMGLIIGRILVGYIFLKPYYIYRVYTVYDFLLIRFGKRTRYVVSAFFLLMRVLASGVRLYVPSLVMVLAWKLFVQGQEVTYRSLDTWQPYAYAIALLTIVTGIYTVLGGIKAVVWTDVIQAALMFTSALVAIVTILYHIGGDSWNLLNGFAAVADLCPNMIQHTGYFRHGFEDFTASSWGLGFWHVVKMVLVNPYTLPAALIATTLGNMAAFGTDQDMVQRMLTAETYKKSRRSLITAALMDVPIAAAFTFIGVLLFVFYTQNPDLRPPKDNDVFGQYILNVMPVVIRGFVLAGVFATAMGSLSAALNALATTMTNDWYIAIIAPGKSERHYVFAARLFTALFAVLMILIAVAFAYLNVKDPTIRIIPVALGIAGYILGPMLGVFLIGMLTKRRGSDWGNVIAFLIGIVGILVVSGQTLRLANWVAPRADRSVWALPEVLRPPTTSVSLGHDLPAGGTYFVGVSGYGAGESGQYTLTLRGSSAEHEITAVEGPVVVRDASYPLSLYQRITAGLGSGEAPSDTPYQDTFAFSGPAGEEVTATVSAGFDAYLYLLDSDGQVLSEKGADLANSTVPFTWYAIIGTVITFFIGIFFRTPRHVVEEAARRRVEGHRLETERTGEQH